MLHPSSLIRLAVWGSVALLVRSIVREANDARPSSAVLLPPPSRNGKDRAANRKPAASKAARAR